jgi:hypothetical protein
MRPPGRSSTTGGLGAYYGVEKETLGGFAKTVADGVGREKPVCRQPLPPVQAGSFNLALVFSEGVALRRPAQSDLNNTIDHALSVLPFHHELAWIHSVLGDDVEQSIQLQIVQHLSKWRFALAREVDGIEHRGSSPTALALIGRLRFSSRLYRPLSRARQGQSGLDPSTKVRIPRCLIDDHIYYRRERPLQGHA